MNRIIADHASALLHKLHNHNESMHQNQNQSQGGKDISNAVGLVDGDGVGQGQGYWPRPHRGVRVRICVGGIIKDIPSRPGGG